MAFACLIRKVCLERCWTFASTGDGRTLIARNQQFARDKEQAAMSSLSSFPITKRWPPRHPDRLQLYSLPTPNGVKVSIMLEEIGLPYEVHLVDFNKDDQKTPEFLSLNPERKNPGDP